MDGVLVDSEHAWTKFKMPMLEKLIGKKLAHEIGPTPGLGVEGVFEKVQATGSTVTEEDIARGFDTIFRDVYAHSSITEGLDVLGEKLIKLGYKLGLVTQSPRKWLEYVLPRIPIREHLEVIVCLGEHPELRRKPAPDGYLEAFRELDAEPKTSFVLEDSNLGIQAAKASGAYTIGFRGNLLPGYEQQGADAYADTMEDVAAIVAVQ